MSRSLHLKECSILATKLLLDFVMSAELFAHLGGRKRCKSPTDDYLLVHTLLLQYSVRIVSWSMCVLYIFVQSHPS